MEAPPTPSLKAPRRKGPRRQGPVPSRWPGIPLGRIFGFHIRIDVSWLIIFALVAISMVGYFSQGFPELSSGRIWVAAVATTLILFTSLLLHELSHSLVARAKGLEVTGITLFMFGGVSQLQEEPKRPSDEFLIAVVGPVASVLLGLVFLALQMAFPVGSLGHVAAGWLGRINVALAIFNLLPGFPLDGGRILRAGIWGATKDFRRATRVASFMGSVVAFGLVGWGVIDVLWNGRFIEGLWFGLIGWFLLVASRQSVGQMELRDNLRRLRVEQAMRSTCPKVPANLTLDRFVDDFVFRQGGKCFFVTEDDVLQGLMTLDEVRRIDRDEWPRSTVRDIMVPITQVKSVTPSDTLLAAFERMNEHSLNQLPVMEGDRVVGVITRNDIFRLVARYLELTEQPLGI